MGIPEFPHGRHRQSADHVPAGGRHRRVRDQQHQRHGRRDAEDRQGTESYYIVGYTPPESAEGSCHTLKVKVDKGGTTVRSRAGYCNVKSRDVLAGNPIEKTLESRATATAAGTIAASMRAPFFYTGANTARVAVAIEIPSESIKFEKVKGKMHAGVNVLGIAYKPDGSVGGAFQRCGQAGFREPEGSAELQGKADALREPVRRRGGRLQFEGGVRFGRGEFRQAGSAAGDQCLRGQAISR